MSMLQNYPAFLSERGIPLDVLGLKDIGLSRANALLAVNMLRDSKRIILGGDVYHRYGERIESALANWFVEPKQQEDYFGYLKRSWDTAEKYIEGYPKRPGIEPLFLLVVGEARY